MAYQYNLSDFSNKLLDRIGEIYYGSIGEELPANFDTIKQNFKQGNIINSYEEKLKSERGNLGYYDVSISEIVNDFLKYLGSRDHWEIIREGNSLKLKKIGRPGLYILYSPQTIKEKTVSLFSSLSRGSSPRGSDSSRSTTPVSFYSPFITPSSSPRGDYSDSSQVTTSSSSPSGQEVSLDDFLKNNNNSNKGGKKRSKRRRSKRRKSKRRKSRKGKSKRRK